GSWMSYQRVSALASSAPRETGMAIGGSPERKRTSIDCGPSAISGATNRSAARARGRAVPRDRILRRGRRSAVRRGGLPSDWLERFAEFEHVLDDRARGFGAELGGAVGERGRRVVVHFHEEAVGAGCRRGAGERPRELRRAAGLLSFAARLLHRV